jgi:hypothetical protein
VSGIQHDDSHRITDVRFLSDPVCQLLCQKIPHQTMQQAGKNSGQRGEQKQEPVNYMIAFAKICLYLSEAMPIIIPTFE